MQLKITIKIDDTGRSHLLLRSTRKRKYNEIEDDEKEMFKKELEKIRKEKEGLECEIDLLRDQWNKYEDEHGRMD